MLVTVRLKADTTHDTVRLKPDTTYRGRHRNDGDARERQNGSMGSDHDRYTKP